MIIMGESIRQIWVNSGHSNLICIILMIEICDFEHDADDLFEYLQLPVN